MLKIEEKKTFLFAKPPKAYNNNIDCQSSKIYHCVDCLYDCVNMCIVIAEADWLAKAAVSFISARFAKLQSLKIAFFKLLNLLL